MEEIAITKEEKKYLMERRKKIITELSSEGYSKADIARILNVSRARIVKICKELGLVISE